jgi:choline dehydrogenase
LHFRASEFEDTAWSFWVNHFDDLGQQEKDSKMIYKLADGTQYRGLYPPEGAEPLGILYPRAGTLGGCSRHNAMITMYPFDRDWDNIATLTGDESWASKNMRQYFEKIENNKYLPTSVIGHGYGGWLTTSVTYLGLVLQDFKFLNLVLSGASAAGKGVLTGLISTVTGCEYSSELS